MDPPQQEETPDQQGTEEATEGNREPTRPGEQTEEDNEDRIELARVNFRKLVHRDLVDANKETKRMVEETKANISGLINFCNKDSTEPKDESQAKARDYKRRASNLDAEQLIREGLYQAKEKAKTDLKVIQLYDKSLTTEIQDQIKRDVIDTSITIKEKTKTDFQNTQENTESMIHVTKSTVENFITTISENVANEEGNENPPGVALWQKMKAKAQKDFNKSNEKSHKLSSKAMYQIQDNMNIFLTIPTGRKSREEIESEEFVKENIVEFSEKIKGDIIQKKLNFSRDVEEAKDNVGLNLLFSKNADFNIDSSPNKLRRFYDKTRNDFKEVNDKIQEDVFSLKEQITDIPVDVPTTGNEVIPDVLNNFPETAQADFKDTNEKIQEDVKELKSKITQGMTIPDNPETSKRQKRLGKAIESKLNEFQDMAKNDFQETNERVMDKVEVAKAKIDQSINKLKDTLFFKGL